MEIDLQEIFRVLNEIMPYLAQQKMRTDFERKRMQMYLQREMEVMRGRAGYREKEQARGYDYATMLKLLGSIIGGTKGLDRPGMAGIERAFELGVPLRVPKIAPGQYEEAVRPYTEMMADQAGALEAGEYLPVEKMGVATQLTGSKRVMDFLEELGRTKAGREARGLKEREVKVKEEELKLKGKKTPEEARKELKEREKRVFSLREKIAKPTEDVTPEQIKLWKNELSIEEEEINKLKKQVGKKTDEDYKAMAAHLNKEGFKIIDIDTNKDLRQWLAEQGYSLTRLRGLFLRGK